MRHSLLTKNRVLQQLDETDMHSGSIHLTGDTLGNAVRIDDETEATIRVEVESDSGISDSVMVLQETSGDVSDDGGLFIDDSCTRAKRRRSSSTSRSISELSQSVDGLSKRQKRAPVVDDKKKILLKTTYEGFSIYGKVLCLIVKKRENTSQSSARDGHATMRDWITSTQMLKADNGG